MRRWLGRVSLRLFGWEAVGEGFDAPKCVFIAAPHTSNWDLFFMLAVAWTLRVPMSWAGKHTLFKIPLWGWYLSLVGGLPVVRGSKTNTVQQLADHFKGRDRMYLAMAPSGTRGLRDSWKSGFYHVAVAADVPIVCGFLDYKNKRGGVGPIIHPTGDVKADMDRIREFYGPIEGKKNALKSTIRLRDEDAADAG